MILALRALRSRKTSSRKQGKATAPSLVTCMAAFFLAACLAFLSACTSGGISGTGGTSGAVDAAASSAASVSASSLSASSAASSALATSGSANISVEKGGTYTDKDHVALYVHTYHALPSNYMSKTKAIHAGWDAESGNLWDVCPGKSIGGGTFYNDDGLLPEKEGRTWKECDIDYAGGYRGAKRLCYSNDGLIYYTDNHYRTFEQLY